MTADSLKPALPGRILVVDDEPSLLRITARIIHRLGYQTLEAASGEEALRLAIEHSGAVALVITDVVMGGMDGVRTAEEIRRQAGDVRVLFISGHGVDDLVRRHGLSESADFLQKPFTPKDLSAKIQSMLEAPSV